MFALRGAGFTLEFGKWRSGRGLGMSRKNCRVWSDGGVCVVGSTLRRHVALQIRRILGEDKTK